MKQNFTEEEWQQHLEKNKGYYNSYWRESHNDYYGIKSHLNNLPPGSYEKIFGIKVRSIIVNNNIITIITNDYDEYYYDNTEENKKIIKEKFNLNKEQLL